MREVLVSTVYRITRAVSTRDIPPVRRWILGLDYRKERDDVVQRGGDAHLFAQSLF